ncbi:hypothetical protein SBA3_750006 [Candidatus Sulfopaludibacter sp. SbA3]|nr:hypothetical protein SBA3_750006 [Candidatus Sulfopaludibacter sp. SbA3]
MTQETVNPGVLDTIEVVYLDCIESPQSFRRWPPPGRTRWSTARRSAKRCWRTCRRTRLRLRCVP